MNISKLTIMFVNKKNYKINKKVKGVKKNEQNGSGKKKKIK